MRTYQETEVTILRAAVESIRDLVEPQAAFAAAPSRGGYFIGPRYGLHDPRWDEIVVRPGLGLGGRVIEQVAPIALDDYCEDSSITGDYRPVVRAENLKSIACIPVVLDGRAGALLYVASHRGQSIGGKLVDQIRRLAVLTALGLSQVQKRSNLATDARRALCVDDPEALREVARRLVDAHEGPRTTPALTTRQLEVLVLLSLGMSNAELALQLGISEATGKEHVRDLCSRLGASSRLQAVARGRESGLV